jgi:endonuclease-3 related protein
MRKQLMKIFGTLLDTYGKRFWWPAETPFEVCVGAILTQNTNWGNVEKAIANLKREGILSLQGLRDVPTERLAELIRPAGYFNVKSVRLKDFIAWLVTCHGGSLDAFFTEPVAVIREALLQVRGVGPETCDSILLYAGHKPSFVVDAYTKRLFSRLGFISHEASYDQVRDMFMENLPSDVKLYNEYHALIVEHCKELCRTRPLCRGCPLFSCCGFPSQ